MQTRQTGFGVDPESVHRNALYKTIYSTVVSGSRAADGREIMIRDFKMKEHRFKIQGSMSTALITPTNFHIILSSRVKRHRI